MRITLLRAVVVTALTAAILVLAGPIPAASNQRAAGTLFYVVRPDPRLCPSPRCGGYWVSLANHARTRCDDGLSRPRCYVANAIGEDRHPLKTSVADGSLARAVIESRPFDGFGRLGVLVVADVFSPAGRAPSTGRFFRLVDTGIRCIRSPCFSIRAARVNRSSRTTVSGIDIGTAGATAGERARAEAALGTKNGLFVQGRIVPSHDGGLVFQAARFFLRSKR